MKVGPDCNRAQNCSEKGFLMAEMSQGGGGALMDGRAGCCYINTNCRGLLESPDASLMSDAMLESSRDVETAKIA